MKRNGHAIIAFLTALFACFATPALAQLSSIERAELRDVNVLVNPGFETGTVKWTASGGSFSRTTTAANVAVGTSAALWNASANGQTLSTTAVTMPYGMEGQPCLASIMYQGGDANLQLEARVFSGGSLGTATFATSTTYTTASVPFTCPAGGSAIFLRVNALADAAAVYLDQAFLGLAAKTPAVAVSPTIASLSPTAVTAVGTSGNPQLGHVIDANDFSGTTSQYSFFNLASTVTDGNTTNAKNLTNATSAAGCTAGGTAAFTGTNVLGTANSAIVFNGTSNSLCSTSSYFNPGNGVSWTGGGWFAATAWNSGTHVLFSNWQTVSDRGFEIFINGGSTLTVTATNTAASEDLTLVGPSISGFSANSWHHVALTFDYPNTKLKMYLDGKLAASATLANVRSLSSSVFRVGADSATPGAFFAGKVEDFFFTSGGTALTDDDIRKLASRRLDHSKGILPSNQLVSGNWGRSDSYVTTPLDSSWVVSKDSNRLWYDLSGVATGAFVDYTMQNTGLVGTQLVPNSTYDVIYNTTPGTTIAHGLGTRPKSIVYNVETTTNKWTPVYISNFCEADDTNLYCDWTGLTTPTSSNRLEIVASGAPVATAVPLADATTAGIVSTAAQTFAGDKTFTGSIKTTSCSKSANYTITDTDGCSILLVNGAVAPVITLPSAATNAGRRIYITHSDSGTTAVIVQRGGSDTIEGSSAQVWLNNQHASMEVVSDGVSKWYYTQPVKDSGTFTGVAVATENCNNTPVVGGNWTRIGNFVTVSGHFTCGTTASTAYAVTMNPPVPRTSGNFASYEEGGGAGVGDQSSANYTAWRVLTNLGATTILFNSYATANSAGADVSFTYWYKL